MVVQQRDERFYVLKCTCVIVKVMIFMDEAGGSQVN
jgi:hypothetical protein